MRITLAKLTVLGRGARNTAEQTMRVAFHERAMTHHRGHRARANGEIGEIRFDVVSRKRFCQQRLHRLLDQRSTILTRNHERAANLAGFDQTGRDRQRIEKTETRIREIENLGGGRKADFPMRKRRRRRFQHVATHRRVDEQLDALRSERGLRQHRPTRLRTGIRRTRAGRPHPPLADARHEFEPPDRQLESLIERAEPLLDRGGTPHLFGQRDRQRLDADVFEFHAAALTAPSASRAG